MPTLGSQAPSARIRSRSCSKTLVQPGEVCTRAVIVGPKLELSRGSVFASKGVRLPDSIKLESSR